jgi:hypothetical protein
MSFKSVKILKFSEAILENPNLTYTNLQNFDDKVVVLRNIPQIEYKKKLLQEDIDPFFEKIEKYEVIVFDDCEHIWIDSWIDLLKMLNDANKIIIMTTFSIGIRHYLDKVIPNNKIHYNSIQKLAFDHLQPYQSLLLRKLDLLKKRQYLLKCFSYNRSPHRDYVFDFLIKNKLIDGNNVSFHNHPFEELGDDLDLKSVNQSYCFDEVNNLLKDVDLKRLNNLRIIPETERFNIQHQGKQTENNFDASYNSYFEIITESQVPISNDPSNSLHYTYSITRRTLTPILFGNVFHIMPSSKLYEQELIDAGFQLFFKDDEDFLTNLNEDFYFNQSTQNKIKHNYMLLSTIVYEYNRKHKFESFILQKIEQIYSIKFEK